MIGILNSLVGRSCRRLSVELWIYRDLGHYRKVSDLVMLKPSLTNLGKAVAKYAAADAAFDDKPPISFFVRCYYWYYAIGFVVAVLGVIVGLTSITFGPFPPLTSLFGK